MCVGGWYSGLHIWRRLGVLCSGGGGVHDRLFLSQTHAVVVVVGDWIRKVSAGKFCLKSET